MAVLEDIVLEVKEGEFWALIGPNGSGKSTLISIILGLLKPDKGSVKLFGSEVESFQAQGINWLCLAKIEFL